MLLSVEKGLLSKGHLPHFVIVNIADHCIVTAFVPHNLRQLALRLVVLDSLWVDLQDLRGMVGRDRLMRVGTFALRN